MSIVKKIGIKLKNLVNPDKTSINDYATAYFLVYKCCNFIHFTMDVSEEDGEVLVYMDLFDGIYNAIYLGFECCILYWAIAGDSRVTNISFVDVGQHAFTVMAVLFQMIANVLEVLFHSELERLIRMLNEFDKKMHAIGFPINNIEIFSTIRLLIIYSAFVINSSLVYVYYTNTKYTFFEVFYQRFPISMFFCMLTLYYGFLTNTYHRMRRLNACFAFYFTEDDFRRKSTANRKKTLKSIRMLYVLLCEIVDKINYCFRVLCVICFSVYISYTTYTVFGIYYYFSHLSKIFSIHIFGFNIICTVFFVVSIAFIVYCSQGLRDESYELAKNIHIAIIIQSRADVLIVEKVDLQSFSYQVLQRRPMADCVLFSIDWTLFYSSMTAMCGYLVVLVQFDNPNLLKSGLTSQSEIISV